MGKKNNVIGWIKFLVLAGASLKEGEMVQLVDDGVMRTMNAAAILEVVQMQSNFQVLYDNLHIEVRDRKGLKVLDFDLESEEELDTFANAVDKTKYAMENQLLDVRKAVIGNDAFKETYDEMTNMPVDFKKIKDDTELLYKLEGADKLIDLAIALSGGSLQDLNKGVHLNDSTVRMIDADEGKIIEGSAKDVIKTALLKCGLKEETIDSLIHDAEEVEEKENTEGETALGNTEDIDRTVYNEEELKGAIRKEKDGTITVLDGEVASKAKASDIEVLNLLEEELKNLDKYAQDKSEGEQTQSAKIIEFLRMQIDKKRIDSSSIVDMYCSLIDMKNGKESVLANRASKQATKLRTEYVGKHKDEKGIDQGSMNEFIKKMVMKEEDLINQADEREKALSVTTDRYEKLNMQQQKSKDKTGNKEFYKLFEQVEKEKELLENQLEEAYDEYIEQSELVEKLQFAQIYDVMKSSTRALRKEQRFKKYLATIETEENNKEIYDSVMNGDVTSETIANVESMFYEADANNNSDLIESEDIPNAGDVKIAAESIGDNSIGEDQGLDF